ncbi:ABC transporter ATP-binding protein [Burkholderia sp. SRS-W-2-2016]|uniref:ABC transporter ATP-binding protein n=1 Tax=Burkholderia sp. SRS-W-2-2016 TaxID=1926878 RepID=UPI000A62682B|nr:ABC transporter ATP-binding protein [Burkholderia sp. SRS-W-2-2016]
MSDDKNSRAAAGAHRDGLQAVGLTKRFGGLVAVRDVSVRVEMGTVHSVIGTNGAGKSTLINLLCGELTPTSGDVKLHGQSVGSWPQRRRACAGIGRTYQRNNVFAPLTVRENCRLAAQAHHPRPWRVHEAASQCAVSNERASEALERTGLTKYAERLAGTLSHGQKRQLEIAMCLAGRPDVLLLDEPLAGMGPEETSRVLDLLNELRPTHAILLVEHDMDAVFAISDRVTVMVDGAVIASDTAAAVKEDRAVQNAYLGAVDAH